MRPTKTQRKCSSTNTIGILPSNCYDTRHRSLDCRDRQTYQYSSEDSVTLIPSILVEKPIAEMATVLKPLETMYKEDLDDDSFMTELKQWYLKWKNERDTHGIQALPKSLAFTLPRCSSYFNNIQILLRILCTLPVTSCSAERSFSALKRVKTNIRSTMTNHRLTSLTLLHIHHDIPVDISEVIDEFAAKYPRP